MSSGGRYWKICYCANYDRTGAGSPCTAAEDFTVEAGVLTVYGHGERALAVTTQLVLTVTATLHFLLFKFGCTSAFKTVVDTF